MWCRVASLALSQVGVKHVGKYEELNQFQTKKLVADNETI